MVISVLYEFYEVVDSPDKDLKQDIVKNIIGDIDAYFKVSWPYFQYLRRYWIKREITYLTSVKLKNWPRSRIS